MQFCFTLFTPDNNGSLKEDPSCAVLASGTREYTILTRPSKPGVPITVMGTAA